MRHRLKASQYAVLLAITLTASVGDTLLSRGMSEIGPVGLHHLSLLWHALFNPYVSVGIVLLIGFFASYMTALSWADLTFVMPATAFGYVVVALLSRWWLHEQMSPCRWAGIVLIVCAVGFVADGPSKTEAPEAPETPELAKEPAELTVMDAGVGR